MFAVTALIIVCIGLPLFYILRDSRLDEPTRLTCVIVPAEAAIFAALVLKAVIETVERVNANWWNLPEREVVPENVLRRIDAHVKLMTPILSTCADR